MDNLHPRQVRRWVAQADFSSCQASTVKPKRHGTVNNPQELACFGQHGGTAGARSRIAKVDAQGRPVRRPISTSGMECYESPDADHRDDETVEHHPP